MPYTAVTLATLRQELSDKFENLPLWTSPELTTLLNESLRVWNMLTGQWHQRVVFQSSNVNGAPQVYYSLPGAVLYNMRMEWNSLPVEQTTLGDLDNGKPGWEGHTTKTSGVPTRPSLWAPVGLTMIAVWPADSYSLVPNSFALDGVAATPILVNDSDFVDLGQDEHHAILLEACHLGLFKAAKEWLGASLAYHKEFVRMAGDKNARLKASTFYRKLMGLDLNRGQRPLRFKPAAAEAPQPAQPQEQGA